MVRFLVPLIVAVALVPVGTSAAAPTARTFTFTKLLHRATPMKGPLQLRLGTSALVLDSLNAADIASDVLLNDASVAAIQRTQWQRQFVVGVFTVWPTRGYDVAIRRVTAQQIGGGLEQLCVVVAVRTPAPGRVVLQERTAAYDVVRVAREPAGYVVPHAVVVRSGHGHLLYWTKDGRPVRPGVCRAA
jgi:Fe2+ transport system protein FeoA